MNDNTLRDVLRDGTPEPPHHVDFDDVARSAGRRRKTKLVTATAGAALAVGLATVGVATLQRQNTRETRPADGSTAEPTTDATNGDTGCPDTQPRPEGSHIVYDVDFVHVGGRMFIAEHDLVDPKPPPFLREQVGVVNCTISDLTDGGTEEVVGEFRDGNATNLPVGTRIFSILDYDPACRVGALYDGKVVQFLTHHELNQRVVPTDCALTRHGEPLVTATFVSTHCGVQSVVVHDQLMLADPPLGDHNPPPGWDENAQYGILTFKEFGTAEFVTPDGLKATFRRAPEGSPNPNAGCE